MEEKEDKSKPIHWDSSRLYIPLTSEKDSGTEPTGRVAIELHTKDHAEYLPPQQQLAFLPNGLFKNHTNNMVYDWHHLSCDKWSPTWGPYHRVNT